MMFGQPEGLVAQFLRQDTLTHLVDQDLPRGNMYIRQRSVVDRHTILGNDHRKVRCTIVKDADFEHVFLSGILPVRPGSMPVFALRITNSLAVSDSKRARLPYTSPHRIVWCTLPRGRLWFE